MNNKTSFTTYVLWTVFIALLLVLWPHTAWAFRQFEPAESAVLYNGFTWADLISYVVAFAFEASIAVLVHKLSKRIEDTPKRMKAWYEKLVFQYVNPISFGLLIATVVSGLANLAHAVQFGVPLKIFTAWGISSDVYSFAFGGILPLVSLTFANVLSNVVDDEEAPNPELTAANETIRNLHKQLRDSEGKAKQAEEKVRLAEEKTKLAEERFNEIGDFVKMLFGEDKRQRIVAAHKQWPELPGSAIAIITGSSGAYVSETLKDYQPLEA